VNTKLKKRTFRQVLKQSFDPDYDMVEGRGSFSSDKRNIKFNEKMLRKATATVDLISQKAK